MKSADYGNEKPPYGPGTFRQALVGKARYREPMLVWDKPNRWGYYIHEATIPIAKAQLETTELEALPNGGTLLRWTIAVDRKWLLLIMAPLLQWHLNKIGQQCCQNIERLIQTDEQ